MLMNEMNKESRDNSKGYQK